jgi:hypothetical protein
MVYADVLPYLYRHLPDNLEMKVRIENPANLDAFFTELRKHWLESGGRVGISNGVVTTPIYTAKFQGN